MVKSGMEKEKNIILIVIQYLKENIKIAKDMEIYKIIFMIII